MRGIMSDLQPGLEAIKYQRDTAFAKELESIAIDYWNATNGDGSDDYAFNKQFTLASEKILNKRFGFNFQVRFNRLGGIYVLPTILYADNGLFRATQKETSGNKVYKKANKILGDDAIELDLKNAKVIKFPKELKVRIDIDIIWLLQSSGGQDASSYVAVLLHEVGHQFTLLEYLSDMGTHNRLLRESLVEGSDKKDIEKYRIKVRSILKPEETAAYDAEVSTKTPDAWVYTSSAYMQKRLMRSSIGMYNDTSNEQVADQFASRFGYGVALAKLFTRGRSYTRADYVINSLGAFLFTFGMTLLFTIVILPMPLLIAAGLKNVLAFGSVLASTFLLGGSSKSEAGGGDIHDRLYERIQRIKRDQILMMKDISLTKKEMADVIQQWEDIDSMVRKTTKTWSDDIWNFAVALVQPSTSRYNSDRAFTDLVEELSINSLYARHKQLDSLT